MILNKIIFLLLLSLIPQILGAGNSKNLAKHLRTQIEGEVHQKGTVGYEKRRLIHNGLCSHMYPDLIAGNYLLKYLKSMESLITVYFQSLNLRKMWLQSSNWPMNTKFPLVSGAEDTVLLAPVQDKVRKSLY